MSPPINRANLPRDTLPHGEFQLADLPEHVPNYSGDLEGIDVAGEVPRSAHMALAIAMTNVDRCMAFEDCQRDTLDALAQLWRALTPEGQTVTVEYSRSATSVDVTDPDGRAVR